MRSLTAVLTAALVLLPAAPAWAAGQPPVVVDDAVDFRNVALPGQVKALDNDSDPDGDPLVYTAVGAATKGQAYVHTNGLLYYQPHQFATGTDSFTYTVSDGQGNSQTGTVTVTLWSDLPAPVGLTISRADAASATLTWPAAAGAVRYQVFRNTVLTATTSGLTWTDTAILPGPSRVYSYRIAAVNAGGFGGQQSTEVFHHSPQPVPTGLAVDLTENATSLALTWSKGTSGGPWNVYRDGALLTSTSAPAFTDTGLVTGRQYGYQVQHAGHSSPTSVTPPSALSAAVTGTPGVLTDIGRLFRELGSSAGVLGPVTIAERAIPGGRQQDHRNGLILQQDGEPALAVTNPLAAAYLVTGGPSSYLGFPVAVQENGLRGGGSGQLFEGGSIWRTGTGTTHVVPWLIEDGWAVAGWEDGPLGWPISGLIELDSGYAQEFEGGAVYWSAATGSHAVIGPLHERHATAGGLGGPLGYPTAGVICGLRGGGCAQRFQGGWIHWSPTTGAQVTTGTILATWSRLGGQNGPLGYPTASAVCGLRNGGCAQRFQGGWIHWSPTTGAQVTTGTILATWSRQGGQNGPLGYPTASAVCGLRGGGCAQRFQGGWIHWSPTTGAQVTTGTILATWSRQGGQNGPLGYPTASAVCGLRNGGCAQRFQGGWIHWSPTTGAQVTTGAILATWSRLGGQNSRLGYPTAAATVSGGVAHQTFQGGSITIDLRSGRVAVRYR